MNWLEIKYLSNNDERMYVRKVVDENTIERLTTAKLLDLPFKDIDGDADKRWNMKKVNAELLQAIEQGESFDKMEDRLHRVAKMNEVSAIRNARTMTTSFENLGRLDGMREMKENGTILKKQWLAVLDNNTRDAHKALNGEVADVDKPFNEGEEGEIMYPGDPNAAGWNVYNCRCTLTYEIEGFERTLPKGIIEVI